MVVYFAGDEFYGVDYDRERHFAVHFGRGVIPVVLAAFFDFCVKLHGSPGLFFGLMG